MANRSSDETHSKLLLEWLSSPRALERLDIAARDAIRRAGFPNADTDLLRTVRDNTAMLNRVNAALNAVQADRAKDEQAKLCEPADRPSSRTGVTDKKSRSSRRKKSQAAKVTTSGSSKVSTSASLVQLISSVLLFVLLILATAFSQDGSARTNLRRVVDINQTPTGRSVVAIRKEGADMEMKRKMQEEEERIIKHDTTSTPNSNYIFDKKTDGQIDNYDAVLYAPDFKTSACRAIAPTAFRKTQVKLYETIKDCCEAK